MALSWECKRGMNNGTGYNEGVQTLSGTGGNELSETLAIGTNTQFSFTCDVSQIVGLYIKASTACTIKTNSSGSPVNTFTMAANAPFLWTSSDGGALRDTAGTAVSTDITTLYVTNVAQCDLVVRVLTDATP